MPLENTGNKIISIKQYKSKIVITFISKEKLEMPPEIFTSYYLYVGKYLSDKELEKIENEIRVYDLFKYAKKLLMSRPYTEYKIREKLYLKEATKEDVDLVVISLKKAHLLNDKEFVISYIEYGNNQGYGKNKIIAKLLEKGVFKENIDLNLFDDKEEIKKARSWLTRLEKRYDKYPYQAKKEHVVAFLVNQGFDIDIARKVGEEISPSNEKDELRKIKVDYSKVYNQYKRRYEGRELKDKIFQALKRKGYKTNLIYQMLKIL